MSGPVPGVPYKWQPTELFKLCVWAEHSGLSMAKTLAERYGITEHNARTRISRLRQLGYDVPTQLGWNGQQPHGCGSAAGYQRHLREGTETCEPCRAHNAARRRAYRATGTTKNTPVEFVPPSTELRFLCECGEWSQSIHRLVEHTVGVHRRPPHRSERTPQ